MSKKLLLTFSLLFIFSLLVSCTKNNNVSKESHGTSEDYPSYSSIGELKNEANIIIEGTIIDFKKEELDVDEENAENLDYYVYNVDIQKCYKGDIKTNSKIKFKQLYEEDGTNKLDFKKGKKYILFLETYKDKNFPASLLNPIQSAYLYSNDSNKIKSLSTENNLILKKENLSK